MTDVERKIGEVYRLIALTVQQENKLVPGEVEGIIKRVFGECNEHLIKEVMRYSNQEFKANYDFILRLVLLNPGTTEEYWRDRHNHYRDSLHVLDTLKLYYNNKEREILNQPYNERVKEFDKRLDDAKKKMEYQLTELQGIIKNQQKPWEEIAGRGLSITDLAFIAIYENKIITRQNANEYLKGTKHKSGEKLYQAFCRYSKAVDRRNADGKRKTENKVERIEKIIPYLSERAQRVANDEVMVLKSSLEEGIY